MHSSEDRLQRTPRDTNVRPSSPKMDDTVEIKVTIPIFTEVFFLYLVRCETLSRFKSIAPVKSEVRAQSNTVGRLWFFLGGDAREYPVGLLRLDPAFAYAEPPSS